MKKWMAVVLIGAVTAGVAMAEETKVPWYKKMFGKSADEQTQVIPPPPAAPAPEMKPMHRRDGDGDWRSKLSPEQKDKMKAHHEALMKLGESARNETDPAKKEAIIADIRTQVTEMVDKMQAEQKKRLEQAEKEMPKLKERLAEAEKNKAARIEEHVQKIISGEMPPRDGKKEGKDVLRGLKGPKPIIE